MLVGIGFVALLTGAIAEAFIRPRAVQEAEEAAASAPRSRPSPRLSASRSSEKRLERCVS
jgi:hypothetical protein